MSKYKRDTTIRGSQPSKKTTTANAVDIIRPTNKKNAGLFS